MQEEQLFNHRDFEPKFKPVLVDQLTDDQIDRMQIWLGGLAQSDAEMKGIGQMGPRELYELMNRTVVGGTAAFLADEENVVVLSEVEKRMDDYTPERREAQPEIDF